MKGMETASVGMRERRKEMRRAVPAERLVPASFVSVGVATMESDEDAAPDDIKNFSVSPDTMAPGLERTVLVKSCWVLVSVSSVTVI